MVLFSRVSRLGRELLLLWRHSDMCSSLMKCVSPTREHISLGICVRGNTCYGQESLSCHVETHIPSELCFPYPENISLGICVSRVEKHISPGICVQGNTYHAETPITRDKCSVEHISLWRQMWREMCFPSVQEQISLGICVLQVGKHISLRICVLIACTQTLFYFCFRSFRACSPLPPCAGGQ